MRKIILWLRRVPSSIAESCRVAKSITDTLIRYIDSDMAKMIVAATPTRLDDELRIAIVDVLNRLVPILKKTSDEGAIKGIAARIGGEVTAILDNKREKTNTYIQCFEKICNENN